MWTLAVTLLLFGQSLAVASVSLEPSLAECLHPRGEDPADVVRNAKCTVEGRVKTAAELGQALVADPRNFLNTVVGRRVLVTGFVSSNNLPQKDASRVSLKSGGESIVLCNMAAPQSIDENAWTRDSLILVAATVGIPVAVQEGAKPRIVKLLGCELLWGETDPQMVAAEYLLCMLRILDEKRAAYLRPSTVAYIESLTAKRPWSWRCFDPIFTALGKCVVGSTDPECTTRWMKSVVSSSRLPDSPQEHRKQQDGDGK